MQQNARMAYECIISILSKLPWEMANEISILQRDHIFEMVKLSIDFLDPFNKNSVCRPLLIRLVRAALCVPLFTEKQKTMLIAASRLQSCPPELLRFVVVPTPEVTEPVVVSGIALAAEERSYHSTPQKESVTHIPSPLKTPISSLAGNYSPRSPNTGSITESPPKLSWDSYDYNLTNRR
jgi:hypothetical protein